MSKEIWIALIAVTGVVLGQAVTWLIARQNRSDARDVISKDLQILKQLRPGTDTHTEFEQRIKKNIARLTEKQDNRDFYRESTAFLAPKVYFVGLAFVGWYLYTLPDSSQSWKAAGLGLILGVLLRCALWLITWRKTIWTLMQTAVLWVQTMYLKHWRIRRTKKQLRQTQEKHARLAELAFDVTRAAIASGAPRNEIEELTRKHFAESQGISDADKAELLAEMLALIDRAASSAEVNE